MNTEPASPDTATSPSGLPVEVLLFDCAGATYLARLDAIDEVLMPALPRPIPGSPAALLGVLNLRGDMLPVIDLGMHLRGRHGAGLSGASDAGPDAGSAGGTADGPGIGRERLWYRRNRILRVNTSGRAVGVAVDAVQGIRTLRPEQRRGRTLADQAVADLLGDLWQLGADTLQEIRFDALLDEQALARLNPQTHRMLS